MLRALRPLIVPLLLGFALLAIALVTRSGRFGRDNPGQPINSAMRQALGQMVLPAIDAERVSIRFPEAQITPSGLRYVIERRGDGVNPPRPGQWVSVHFRESLLDGTLIEDTATAAAGPFNFPFDQRRVPFGWDEALATMTEGEKRTLIVPYWLAYGEKGQRKRVPAKATMVVELELLRIQDAPAPAS